MIRRLLRRWTSIEVGDRAGRVPFSLPSPAVRPMLLIVEGRHDIEFLRRISAILHRGDPLMPNLSVEELQGRVVFVSGGGGSLGDWTLGLGRLGLREFHLYDREMMPATAARRRLVDALHAPPRRIAAFTSKRSLENYLHTEAIFEARGLRLDFGDDDCVPEIAARTQIRLNDGTSTWEQLSARGRKRARDRAKHWLNTLAVDRMSAERLAERDPGGELLNWLWTIRRLLGD